MRVCGSMFPTYSEKAHRIIPLIPLKNAPVVSTQMSLLLIDRLLLYSQNSTLVAKLNISSLIHE